MHLLFSKHSSATLQREGRKLHGILIKINPEEKIRKELSLDAALSRGYGPGRKNINTEVGLIEYFPSGPIVAKFHPRYSDPRKKDEPLAPIAIKREALHDFQALLPDLPNIAVRRKVFAAHSPRQFHDDLIDLRTLVVTLGAIDLRSELLSPIELDPRAPFDEGGRFLADDKRQLIAELTASSEKVMFRHSLCCIVEAKSLTIREIMGIR